jgi:hypothetical protein
VILHRISHFVNSPQDDEKLLQIRRDYEGGTLSDQDMREVYESAPSVSYSVGLKTDSDEGVRMSYPKSVHPLGSGDCESQSRS